MLKKRDIAFTAILLDEPSRKILLERFPPKHANIFAEHITLQTKIKDIHDDLGKPVEFQVYGYGEDDKGQAVSVNLFNVESQNTIPHITISVIQGESPKYSNQLLEKGHEAIPPFILSGVIAAKTKEGFITKLPEEPVVQPQNTSVNTPQNIPLKTPTKPIETPKAI